MDKCSTSIFWFKLMFMCSKRSLKLDVVVAKFWQQASKVARVFPWDSIICLSVVILSAGGQSQVKLLEGEVPWLCQSLLLGVFNRSVHSLHGYSGIILCLFRCSVSWDPSFSFPYRGNLATDFKLYSSLKSFPSESAWTYFVNRSESWLRWSVTLVASME